MHDKIPDSVCHRFNISTRNMVGKWKGAGLETNKKYKRYEYS